jgi:hypothetical protein
MRRRRHQTGWLAVLLVVCTAVVVHHFEPSADHSSPAVAAAHGDHGAPEPTTSMDATTIAICLAILPAVVLLALAIAVGVVLRGFAFPFAAIPLVTTGRSRPPDRRSRAGPSRLCVMRC